MEFTGRERKSLPSRACGWAPLATRPGFSDTAGMSLPSLETLVNARVLFVIAHPGDESIGAGGILNEFRDPWFACLTDGAPANPRYAHAAGCASPIDYARTRRRELAIALALAGHGSERLIALGFTDRELAHSLEGITQAVEVLLQRVRPDYVLTLPYEGVHPDHDATAFAVHTAIAAHADFNSPSILEMTSYHARDGEQVWGEFLSDSGDAPLTIELSAAQRAHKQRLLAAHLSQANTLRDVPTEHEFLRAAPRYDFAHPPHSARFVYENFEGGPTAEQWTHATHLALERLHLASLATAAY